LALCIGHHQPPDDCRYRAEKHRRKRVNCILSVVFILIIKSDVDETWAKAYQLDLEQQSSEYHPHSLRKHKRSTNSKVYCLPSHSKVRLSVNNITRHFSSATYIMQ
jgi:hypothetical protein